MTLITFRLPRFQKIKFSCRYSCFLLRLISIFELFFFLVSYNRGRLRIGGVYNSKKHTMCLEKVYSSLLCTKVLVNIHHFVLQVAITTTLVFIVPPKVINYLVSPSIVEKTCTLEQITVLVPLGYNFVLVFACLVHR